MLKRCLLLLLLLSFVACSDTDTVTAPDTVTVTDTAPVTVPDAGSDTGSALDTAPDLPDPEGWFAGLSPSGVTVHDMMGVASHMSQGVGDDEERDFELDQYESLGGFRFRQHMRWDDAEPVDDEWNFDGYDVQVALAKEHGVQMLPMVGYDVKWARQELDNDSSIPPELFYDYAYHIAEHFCDDIKTYEIWNEPNIARFWEPEPDPDAYGLLLKSAYEAIKAACPDARVGTGGMASWDLIHFDANWWFVREMFAAHPDMCDAFDVMIVHPYTWAQLTSPEADTHIYEIFAPGYVEMVDRLRAIMAENGCGERPIIFTETGWPSYELDEEQQGLYFVRSALISSALGIEGYYWYTFWDEDPNGSGFRPHENYFGLFGWPGEDGTGRREKFAFSALRGMIEAVGEGRFAADLSRQLELPNDVWVLAFVEEGGDVLVAAWDGRDDPDDVDGEDQPLAPDTTFDLALPIPEVVESVAVMDALAASVDAAPVDGVLNLQLTNRPTYVRLSR